MPRGQSPLWRRTKGRQWSKAKQPFRLSAFPTLSYSFLLFPTLDCLSCCLVQKRIKEAIWLNCDLYHQAGGQSSYMDVSTLVKILRVINFKVYKVWPPYFFWPQFEVGQIYCQHPLWKLFNEIRLDCFLEKQWKLNQIEKFNFCQRPDSTPNVLLPRLDRSLIGPKSAFLILNVF